MNHDISLILLGLLMGIGGTALGMYMSIISHRQALKNFLESAKNTYPLDDDQQ